MTERMKLRPARPADLDQALTLLAAQDLPHGGVADHFGDAYCVGVVAGRVAAVAGVEVYGRWGLLRSVVVAPAHRGQGAGQALVRNRIRWAKGHGLEALCLLTTDAAKYFHRLGFRTIERAQTPPEIQASAEFASLCPTTCTVMTAAVTARSAERHAPGRRDG